jgi:hypothetical protein
MARRIIEAWSLDYNACRPHTSLGGLTPNEFTARSQRDYSEERILVMSEGIQGAGSPITLKIFIST